MPAAEESHLAAPEVARSASKSSKTIRSSAKSHKNPSPLTSVLSFAVVGALVSVALWVITLAQTEFRSDFAASPARLFLERWGGGKAALRGRGHWETLVHDLREASDVQPTDPLLHQTLGNAWMVGTVQPWATPVERVVWLEQAIYHYTTSTSLRPSDGLTWALLASAKARSGDFGPAMHQASQNALRLGPNEAHIHEALMPLVLEHWDRVPTSLQQWARTLYERGTASQREAINRMGQKFDRQFGREPG